MYELSKLTMDTQSVIPVAFSENGNMNHQGLESLIFTKCLFEKVSEATATEQIPSFLSFDARIFS